jgi:hypothetical protein
MLLKVEEKIELDWLGSVYKLRDLRSKSKAFSKGYKKVFWKTVEILLPSNKAYIDWSQSKDIFKNL